MVQEAREIARKSGWAEVRTPHLAAALLVDPKGPVVAALRERRIDPELARKMVLSFVPQVAGGRHEPTFGERVRNTLQAVVRRVRELHREKATQDDLYAVLTANAQGPMMRVLQALSQGVAATWAMADDERRNILKGEKFGNTDIATLQTRMWLGQELDQVDKRLTGLRHQEGKRERLRPQTTGRLSQRSGGFACRTESHQPGGGGLAEHHLGLEVETR